MFNIAKTIYAGWHGKSVSRYDLHEAEIIPLGESVNERKKLDLITRKYSSLSEYDNTPLPGFTLYRSDKRNWGSVDSTWLVIDPRGFLVRISSKNLDNILHVTGITEGLIQEKCIWARDNTETKMVLVPISSPNFLEATENTELLENKVAMKEVNIGDTVLLQNKTIGVYMGVASLYSAISDYSSTLVYKPTTQLRRQIIEISPGKYYYQTDLKILKVIKKATTVLTREESVARMNSYIENKSSYFTTSPYMNIAYYNYRNAVLHVSTCTTPKVSLTFEEVTKDEAIELYHVGIKVCDFGVLMLEDKFGDRFLVDHPYNISSRIGINNFNIVKLDMQNLDKTEKITLMNKRQTMWTNNLPGKFSIDDFVKYYKIVKHVKNASYI